MPLQIRNPCVRKNTILLELQLNIRELSDMTKIPIEKVFIRSQRWEIFIDEAIDHFDEQKICSNPLAYKNFLLL